MDTHHIEALLKDGINSQLNLALTGIKEQYEDRLHKVEDDLHISEANLREANETIKKLREQIEYLDGDPDGVSIVVGGKVFVLDKLKYNVVQGFVKANEKIKAIKELRILTNCGLKDGKDAVESPSNFEQPIYSPGY